MKRMFYLTLLLVLLLPAKSWAQTDSEVSFSVDVSDIPGNFAPRHIIAIWIENENGDYINSLAVYGNRRLGYLSTWNDVSNGNKGDAITGATVSSFRTYNVNWNMKDFNGNTVPEGPYVLRIEATSKNGSGPKRNIEFTVGGASYNINPTADSYYKNMTLEYTNNTATGISILNQDADIHFYPNPVKEVVNMDISLNKPVYANVRIIDLTGRSVNTLYKGFLQSGEHKMSFKRDPSWRTGTYFLQLKTNEFVWTRKIVLD